MAKKDEKKTPRCLLLVEKVDFAVIVCSGLVLWRALMF